MFDWNALWVLLGIVVVLTIFVVSGWNNDDEMAHRMLQRLLRRVNQEDEHEDR